MATNSFSEAIERAIAILAAHDAVQQRVRLEMSGNSGHVTVVADFEVSLPSRHLVNGAAPNGVRAFEPVTLVFGDDFPLRAPSIALRHDFNRSHPHINPGFASCPPEPCVVDGNLTEFMHANGFAGVINQISVWLDNAANKTLIDPKQGWEPVRRDRDFHAIVANASKLYSFADGAGRHYFIPFDFIHVDPDADDGGLVHADFEDKASTVHPRTFDTLISIGQVRPGVRRGRGLALVVTPAKLPSGRLPVVDHYLPETVTTVAELRDRAADYGCDRALGDGLKWLAQCAKAWDAGGKWKFPLPVIMMAVRPYPVIGTGSEIELAPYLLLGGMPKLFANDEQTRVWPARHLHKVEPNLLRRLSDHVDTPPSASMVLVGCGSLGSHLAISLGRMGDAPSVVIDNRSLQPHNAARHALLARNGKDSLFSMGYKADSLADALEGLGQKPCALTDNIIDLMRNQKLLKSALPKETWGVVNTTGSLAAREAMLASSFLQQRVIEGALFGEGKIGVLTVEGPARNPNIGDLMALAYDQFRTDDGMREAILAGKHSSREIGQGCNSMTMALPDAVISQIAASMTLAIADMRTKGLPTDGGRLFVGARTGISIVWDDLMVAPFTEVLAEGRVEWSVRISKPVHEAIRRDISAWPNVETGGILMGRISESARMFHVVGLLPAPEDSTRSQSEFVLGIKGRRSAIDEYIKSTANALYLLGTWHSHLRPSGPSPKDKSTADLIKKGRIFPSVMLIATPTGYRALVTGDS